MKRITGLMTLAALIGTASAASAAPPSTPPPPAFADPTFGATMSDSLFWSNVCSSTGPDTFFQTCASARLALFDNGWMELRFWNRAGVDGTWSNAIVKELGVGGVPAPSGNLGTGWDAGFNGSRIAWIPQLGGNGIGGPAPAEGFTTKAGNTDAFCSALAAACVNNSIVTPWSGFSGGGYGVFYWFVDDALSMLDPNLITLQLHVGTGPGGISTSYVCYSDGIAAAYVNGGKTWGECGGDTPDTPQETVPEPATMTLMATGLVGMAVASRRRRKKLQG